MNGLMRKSLLLRYLVLAMLSAFSAVASAQIHGAIQDTNIDGTIVNANHHDHCNEVYLNGGPQNENAQGLPEGEYFFQVTNPSGSVLLSADSVYNRRLKVNAQGRIDGPIPDPAFPGLYPGHTASAGSQYAALPPFNWVPDFNVDAIPNPANGTLGVHLWPFFPTPNNGSVYKIWLIPVAQYDAANAANPQENFGFKDANQKTDNFKCTHQGDPEPPRSSLLQGFKFYDLDHDGVFDENEPKLSGWEIHIIGTLDGQSVNYSTFTDIFGGWEAELDEGTAFEICEVIPTANPAWTQSHPSNGEVSPGGAATADSDLCWEGTVGVDDAGGLDFGNYRVASFSGLKFYDANVNGLNDDNQVVAGVRINILIDGVLYDPDSLGYTTVTAADGTWSVDIDLQDSLEHTFVIEEVLPGTSDPDCEWSQTAPALVDGFRRYTETGSAEDLNFGNVCICFPTEGRTLGFWSNKNGKAILQGNHPAWRALLNGLSLRNADGSDFDLSLAVSFNSAYGTFRTWLLNGNAVNMAYMLSVQLSASTLNVAYNGLDNSDNLMLTPALAACYGSPMVTLGTVQTAANAALLLDGITISGDPNRAAQECLKNILDASNNNLLPVIDGEPCDVVYP